MKRKQRQMIKSAVRVAEVVFLVVLVVFTVALVRQIKTARFLRGDFERTVDITDRVVAKVALWLDDVEGTEVDPEYIRSRTDGIFVTARLTLDGESLRNGSFSEVMDEASYYESVDEAYRLTSDCLKELITERLVTVGYAKQVSDEETEALIKEALGMSLEEYIRDAGLELWPDREELTRDIERSGEFKLNGRSIVWTRDGADVEEEFSVGGGALVIPGTGDVYRKL